MIRRSCYDDDGYVTALSLVTILSACVVLCAIANLVSSSSRKEEAYKRYLQRISGYEGLIDQFMEDFQRIRDDVNDSPFAENRAELLRKYEEYDIEIKDISTGINKVIMPKEFLKSRWISRLLDLDLEKYESRYGWINPRLCDESRIKEILKDHGRTDTAEVFPIFSYMALYNIFYMDDEFVRAVLEYCDVEGVDAKTRRIRELKGSGNVITQERLAEELSLPLSHVALDFLGLKTTFWKVSMKVLNNKISLVVAAVPERFDNRRMVKSYRIVERHYGA